MFRITDFIIANALSVIAKLTLQSQVENLLATTERIKTVRESVCTPEDMSMLVRALVIAEDRRFFSHQGIDTRGLIRAIYLYLKSGKIQGASTITQQLVRVMTHDYRRSLRRKAKEMCLACAIDSEVSKETQAELYLRVAYYGWRMTGCVQAKRHLGYTSPLTAAAAASIVARLRYPESNHPSPAQMERIRQRARYIEVQIK